MSGANISEPVGITPPDVPQIEPYRGPLLAGVQEGEAASLLLAADVFRAEWRSLLAECPWATRCQSVEFCDAWWRVYKDDYNPIIVEVRAADHSLRGLLLLARDRATRELFHVGLQQAEYHTWISRPGDADQVIRLMLLEIDACRLAPRLSFHFLAPGTPVSWIATFGASLWPSCLVGSHRRGVFELGDGCVVAESLKKPSNRSRLRRLGRLGDVRLLTLHDHASLARWLPEIMAQCDVRQGAVHASLPFRDDPKKAAYLLSLAAEPGLARVSLLVAGDELLAAHIGLVDRDSVLLGLITHAPQHGRNSPGKFLLLMLAQQLASEGFSRFDLTPGGSYKERFATHSDEVQSLRIHFRSAEAVVQATRKRAGSIVRRIFPASSRNKATPAPRQLRQDVLRVLDPSGTPGVGAVCEAVESRLDSRWTIRTNHIPDLLLYGGLTVRRSELFGFLADAVARLESGQTLATVCSQHEMILCDWISYFPPDPAGQDETIALLEDGYRSGLEAEAARSASLARRTQHICATGYESGALRPIILLYGKSGAHSPVARELGFTVPSATQTNRWSTRLF